MPPQRPGALTGRADRQSRHARLRHRRPLRSFAAVVERCPDSSAHVGHVPDLAGFRTQGETLDELDANLVEAVSLILEDGEPAFKTEFAGILTVRV